MSKIELFVTLLIGIPVCRAFVAFMTLLVGITTSEAEASVLMVPVLFLLLVSMGGAR